MIGVCTLRRSPASTATSSAGQRLRTATSGPARSALTATAASPHPRGGGSVRSAAPLRVGDRVRCGGRWGARAHECDNPLCVKAAAATDPRQRVVAGSQGDNRDGMARMRRGGGRYAVRRFDSRGIRQERSVALRNAVRHGWRCGCGADGAAWRPSHAVVTYASAHWGRCAWDRVGELGGLARGVATPSWRR